MRRDLFGERDRDSIADDIQALFTALGGALPVRELARAAIARGLFSQDYLENLTLRGAAAVCGQALKRKTEDDLPFAKPTGQDKIWKQRELFTYDEAATMLLREYSAWQADRKELRKLHQWCYLKFGRAPDLPDVN